MIVTKYSKKDFKFEKVLLLHYCELQGALNFYNRIGYSSGVNGWACDYFQFDDIYISTGYNPIGRTVPNTLIKKYESKIDKIRSKYLQYEKQKKLINKVMNNFINDCRYLFD